jgi:hypothetical protein
MNDKIQKTVLLTCYAVLAALFIGGGVQAFDCQCYIAAIACTFGFFFMAGAFYQEAKA